MTWLLRRMIGATEDRAHRLLPRYAREKRYKHFGPARNAVLQDLDEIAQNERALGATDAHVKAIRSSVPDGDGRHRKRPVTIEGRISEHDRRYYLAVIEPIDPVDS